jgi:hypothetical protein
MKRRPIRRPDPVIRRKPGQPPVYRKEFARMAEKHCELGATDADLADLFEVSTTAIENWYHRHPEFGAAVRRGKAEVFDPKVQRSLAQRALGYAVDVQEVKVLSDGTVVRYDIRKQYPPDTTACIFWLKNRDPKQWRDVQNHEHTGKVGLDKVVKEELLDEIRRDISEMGLMGDEPFKKAVVPGAPLGVANANNGKTKH